MSLRGITFCAVLTFFATAAVAQGRLGQSSTITYEAIYDEPYEINKLFVHFMPVFSDTYMANISVGFGAKAQYYYKDKFNINAHTRKAYGARFDLNRDAALRNSGRVTSNRPEISNYYELGGTYHFKDYEEDGKTKFILYSKQRYTNRKWQAKVPEHIEAECKVRKIIGIRLGGLYYDGPTDLRQAMAKQDQMIFTAEGNPIPDDVLVITSFTSAGFYLGGSMSWFRNTGIKPDKGYSMLTSDHLFTAYFDLQFAPYNRIDPVIFNNELYLVDNIRRSFFGLRAGVEGKFNRELGWGYMAEMGFRPSVRGRGFFGMVGISLPIYGTNLEYSKEAFGK